jgi:acyl dehydratase
MEAGEQLPDLKVTPDRFLTVRYAGASGDFNPIHIDDEFARSVGLPGRILHGLWTMAQVARAQTEAAGGPQRLRRLSVQFRGMGVPEQEVVVSSKVREVSGGVAVIDAEARQGDTRIVRRGEAELDLSSSPAPEVRPA